MTEIKLDDLAKQFMPTDIEWRISRAGENGGKVWAMCLAYIDNRAIMNRLDSVCGIDNWQNVLEPWPNGSRCGISIRINGEWVTKYDVANNTDIEPVKGGASDSMKRAGVQWGIGRYLYNLTETWAEVVASKGNGARSGSYKDQSKKTQYFWWLPPQLPTWALPPKEPDPAVDLDNEFYASACDDIDKLKTKEAVVKYMTDFKTDRKKTKINQKTYDTTRDYALQYHERLPA